MKCARCNKHGQIGKTILFKECGRIGHIKKYEGLCADCSKEDQLEREPGSDDDKGEEK